MPDPLSEGTQATQRCPMCGGLGWVLDCNDLGKPGPRMAEFMECFYPECPVSGQPIQSVTFRSARFDHVSRHPSEGYVMAISAPLARGMTTDA